VIAFEGYLRKFGLKSLDGYDYADGRFGDPTGEKAGSEGAHDHPA